MRSFLVLLLLCVSATQAAPETADVTHAELARLDTQLTSLERWLADSNADRETLVAALRASDKAVAALARRQRKAQADVNSARSQVEAIEAEIASFQAAEAIQANALRAQFRAIWVLTRRSPLQMLLEAESPDHVGRLLWFHRYTSRARRTHIARWKQVRSRLSIRLQTLTTALAHLASVRDELREQAALLDQTRADHAALLLDLERLIAIRRDNVAELRANQTRLEVMLEDFTNATRGFSDVAFEALRGRLPWPAPPRILQAFGSPRPPANLPADGVLIAAEPGTPVHTVAAGELVFAEWMRGFGLLAIIDHGGGYMSLYGQLESLTHQVGAYLEAGEQLAAAGRSGGNTRSGVWFEVRNQGLPEDPVGWCQPRSQS